MLQRLGLIWDAFSRRRGVHGPDYKPASVSNELRNRINVFYSEVIAGRLRTRSWGHPENNSHEFLEEMHQALRLLYGRNRLSERSHHSVQADVAAFTAECSAAEFFDFIETSFKLEITWRILSDENDVVDSLNEIFRMEAAPY